MTSGLRTGFGYDLHRLITGRPLVLGGVTIPFEKGLLGHSDADVLVHAACDALLGAAGLGDLGRHFPDSDSRFKDIYSIELLVQTMDMLRGRRFELVNLDATILAEAPKLAPYIENMQNILANALHTEIQCINVKATTMEGLGEIGGSRAMAAYCTVLIELT